MSFTTRPELRGTFGMVASTHWLASAAGMSVLERGGNAFDAAVATGLTLQVVEPHLNGPGGEVPALLFPVDRGEPIALCGQGVAPGAATIERYHELGHELVPGTGVLAACVPGAFGGWLLLLEQFGTWRLADVLEFAIGYAEHGFPLVAGIRATIDRTEELLRGWPGSRDLYLPAPEVGALFRNPALAATYRRIVEESRGGSREQEIEKARRAYYEGFVAEEIDRFSAAEGGLLTGEDMARWRATLEPVAKLEYGGLTVCKTLPWAAGPVGLQQLALLDGFDLAELSPAEFVHVVTECAKLAFADRDALYGDGEVPLETLLSKAIFPVDRGEPIALCGQGVAPGAATIERYHELGHELVPGTGVLAACVPGAFGGWLLLLEQFGTWRLEDVLAFAIGYAEHGFPLVAGIRATIDRTEELLRGWPGSRDLYLPAPEVGALFRNPALAATYRRIVERGARRLAGAGDREGPARVLRGLRRRGDRPLQRRRGRAAHRRGHGALARLARAGRKARVPRADGLQDAALGGGAGGAAAARAARRLRPRRAHAGRVRPRRHRVRQARLRRPRRALRRRRGAARDAALEGVQRRAARARRRGRVRRVPARASAACLTSSRPR